MSILDEDFELLDEIFVNKHITDVLLADKFSININELRHRLLRYTSSLLRYSYFDSKRWNIWRSAKTSWSWYLNTKDIRQGGFLMVKNSALAKEWTQRIEDCRKSGMSINAWCKEQGLKDSTYHYWVKKLKTSYDQNKIKSQQFAEVKLEQTNSKKSFAWQTTGYKLSLNCGNYSIGIADDFNPSTLTELLKVLETL